MLLTIQMTDFNKVHYFSVKLNPMKTRLLTLVSALITAFTTSAQDSLAISKMSNVSYTSTVNEVWGYADNGREFALVGVNTGFSIVEVTDPVNPVEKHFIPGAYSIWRDIKTWSHYAYVVHDSYSSSDTSDGIRIVDLNTVDSANPVYTSFYPSVVSLGIAFDYDRAHNIYIDENGVLYVFGSNAGTGGALMFDLSTNPTAPQYLGEVTNNYYHDGMARGDTLWGAAIYAGQFEVVDVSDKSNPQVLATQKTPYNFCHNLWVSDDNQTVFTTDEKDNAPVAAFDVSDLNNISLLDTIRTSLQSGGTVIPHNTHVLGDFLVTSYYTAGVQIVDASHPDNLVETAWYDTSPFSGATFEGAWGAYPYLPSKNLLVSDRQKGLFVLSTTYPRASFITVLVKDSVSGQGLANAQLQFLNSSISGSTNIYGNFRYGQRDTGTFDVVVTRAGYHPDTVVAQLQAGVSQNLTVCLLPYGFGVNEMSGSPFRVFPNPLLAASELVVEFPPTAAGQLMVTINGMDGRVHKQYSEGLRTGRNSLEPQLTPGVYSISFYADGQLLNEQKLVVVR